MTDKKIKMEDLLAFKRYLVKEERSDATIEKYMRDVRAFYLFLGGNTIVTKDKVMEYKRHLEQHYKISSANSMLVAVNKLLDQLELGDCQVKLFKHQRQLFCTSNRELNREEYERLVTSARNNGNKRLELIMLTIGGTGIRISELPFITVAAVRSGRAIVTGKGKQRIVFLPSKLRKYLLTYCYKTGVAEGSIFLTGKGTPVGRTSVWREMKRLCEQADVDHTKVFPHNLRHLFARICYEKKKDIVYLADILGHSSVETTRIYTVSSGWQHMQMLETLQLII